MNLILAEGLGKGLSEEMTLDMGLEEEEQFERQSSGKMASRQRRNASSLGGG